jgi:hypothetical protein
MVRSKISFSLFLGAKMFKKSLSLLLVLFFTSISYSADDRPAGFKVLGTAVPEEYMSPPTYGLTEQAPETHTNAYKASAKEKTRGYVIYNKNYLESVYPRTTPQSTEVTDKLSIFSAAGEYEPITFTIFAFKKMTDVSVTVSDLKGPAGSVIKASNVDVRSVRCWPRRIWHQRGEYIQAPWFLEKRPKIDINMGSSKRYWMTVWVPKGTAPGVYKGSVKVKVGNCDDYDLSLNVDVLDIKLMTPPTKQCIYYHMQDELNPVQYQPYSDLGYYYKDAVNMKEHGLNGIFMMIPVEFSGHMEGDKAVFDLDPLAPFIGPCMDVGLDTIIFNMTLSQILPSGTGPSKNYGVNIRGFVDSYLARGWKMPILSYGDEADAGDTWPRYLNEMKISKSYVPEAKTYTTVVYPWNADKFEPYLDIRAHALPDLRVISPARVAGRELWQYSGAHEDAKQGRFYRGVWGSMLGLDGMLDWLYFLLYDKDAYFDDLGGGGPSGGPNHRGYVVPTPDGPLPSPAWEGLREGTEDGKYLYTLKELIVKGNNSGNPEIHALASKAQTYIFSIYDQVNDIPEYVLNATFPHRVVSATITDIKFFDDFRYASAQYIIKLQKKLAGL